MKDFKKISKLLIKRNGSWLILISLIIMLVTVFFSKHQTDQSHDVIIDNVTAFENNLEKDGREIKKVKTPKKIDKDYLVYADNLRDEIVAKYKLTHLNGGEYIDGEDLSSENMQDSDEYYVMEASVTSYDSYRHMFDNYNSYASIFGLNINALIILFILILAVLFTSMEHMTNYYEFSKTLPWSRTKDLIMKFKLSSIIVFGFLLVYFLINYYLAKSSPVADMLSINYFNNFVKQYLFYEAMLMIFLAAGSLSGNIFGHMGLIFISFAFSNITGVILSVVRNLFTGEYGSYHFIEILGNFLYNKCLILQTIVDPMTYLSLNKESIVGILILGLIIFITALLIVKRQKVENSGMFVVFKPIKIFAKTYAIFFLTSLIVDLILSLSEQGVGIFGFALYLLILFASYKIFDILFSLKIKL